MKFRVRFGIGDHEPVELAEGENLSEHLTVENSPILFGCRTGICGTCLIEVQEQEGGELPPPGEYEKDLLSIVAPGNPRARLACQLNLRSNIKIKPLEQE